MPRQFVQNKFVQEFVAVSLLIKLIQCRAFRKLRLGNYFSFMGMIDLGNAHFLM